MQLKCFDRAILLALCVAVTVLSQGCKPSLLAGSNLPETRENKAIVTFMTDYAHAIMTRSTDNIMAFVAPDYEDKLTRQQLIEKLEKTFKHIRDIRLSLYVQNVDKGENDGLYKVVYYYNEQILGDFVSGDQWNQISDVNQIVIRQKGKSLNDGFEILSGL